MSESDAKDETISDLRRERDRLHKELRDMTTERDALVRVKIALVDKVEALEKRLAASETEGEPK